MKEKLPEQPLTNNGTVSDDIQAQTRWWKLSLREWVLVFLTLAVGAAVAASGVHFAVKGTVILLELTVGGIILLAVAGYLVYRNLDRILQRLFGHVVQSLEELSEPLNQSITAVVNRDFAEATKHTWSFIQTWMAIRSRATVRIWLIGAMVSLLVAFSSFFATVLLLNQNELLRTQNLKFDEQNKLVDSQNQYLRQQNETIQQQIQLQETQRRNAENTELIGMLYEEQPVSIISQFFRAKKKSVPKWNRRVRSEALSEYVALHREKKLPQSGFGLSQSSKT